MLTSPINTTQDVSANTAKHTFYKFPYLCLLDRVNGLPYDVCKYLTFLLFFIRFYVFFMKCGASLIGKEKEEPKQAPSVAC